MWFEGDHASPPKYSVQLCGFPPPGARMELKESATILRPIKLFLQHFSSSATPRSRIHNPETGTRSNKHLNGATELSLVGSLSPESEASRRYFDDLNRTLVVQLINIRDQALKLSRKSFKNAVLFHRLLCYLCYDRNTRLISGVRGESGSGGGGRGRRLSSQYLID